MDEQHGKIDLQFLSVAFYSVLYVSFLMCLCCDFAFFKCTEEGALKLKRIQYSKLK